MFYSLWNLCGSSWLCRVVSLTCWWSSVRMLSSVVSPRSSGCFLLSSFLVCNRVRNFEANGNICFSAPWWRRSTVLHMIRTNCEENFGQGGGYLMNVKIARRGFSHQLWFYLCDVCNTIKCRFTKSNNHYCVWSRDFNDVTGHRNTHSSCMGIWNVFGFIHNSVKFQTPNSL